MTTQGNGVWVASSIWGLTGLVFAVLLLRFYTRIFYISTYHADDYLNIAAFLLFFVANALLQIAVNYGYGNGREAELSAEVRARMELIRTNGQMLASITTAIAKAAVGIFLLRLAMEPWQRRLIWSTLIVFNIISLLLVIIGWVGCKPMARAWDDRIPGECMDTAPFQTLWGVGTILVDFIFVVLPWVFIWNVRRPRREKIFIAGSLSLGVFAAGSGIMRVVAIRASVYALNVQAVLYTAIEISTTLVCTGIPACIPVYRSWFQSCINPRRPSRDPESQYPHHPLPECTIGGSPIAGGGSKKPKPPKPPVFWAGSWSVGVSTAAADDKPLSKYDRGDGSVLRDEGQLLGGEKEIHRISSDQQ